MCVYLHQRCEVYELGCNYDKAKEEENKELNWIENRGGVLDDKVKGNEWTRDYGGSSGGRLLGRDSSWSWHLGTLIWGQASLGKKGRRVTQNPWWLLQQSRIAVMSFV